MKTTEEFMQNTKKLKPFLMDDQHTTVYAKVIYKKEPVNGYYAIIRRDPDKVAISNQDLTQPFGIMTTLIFKTAHQSMLNRELAERKLEETVYTTTENLTFCSNEI